MQSNLRFSDVKRSLAQIGVSFFRDAFSGEFIVKPFKAKESESYYTDDLEDALFTGAKMARAS